MQAIERKLEKAHLVKIETGQDLLGGLEEACRQLGITDGVIAAAVGSTTAAHVHVVESTNLPPGNAYFKHDGPYDLVHMQGYVMGGRVHAHVSFARAEDGAVIGGHLEDGCPVLTFCIVTVLETDTVPELDTFDAAS